MAKVVGYVRISKEEKGNQSLVTQENAIRDWCRALGHAIWWRSIGTKASREAWLRWIDRERPKQSVMPDNGESERWSLPSSIA